ncbi:DUF6447 family protein [Maritalea porphyrae]|jgi:hypothetical protein|uniref:DUF6447 family protein n=1 Tax=Maritalea porphyrae TaxID=880732 RepID=UPI0022AFAC29|nr:DUF6447 family protein [Maritalea porphyrae]MCZ4271947.1 DUF6447 family protein [Maritalea porphyrae]
MTEQNNTITIDGKEFSIDDLSDQAKAQLGNLQAADTEISRLQVQMAIAQTARNAYAQVLKGEIETSN